MLRFRCLLVGHLFLLALTGCTRPPAQEPLLLGYLATAGESGQRGLQFAIREANAAEGQVGGRRVVVLTPSLDAEGETVQAVATRLVAVNRVPALIGGDDVTQAEMLGRAAQPALPAPACVVAPCAAPIGQLSENVFPARLAPADQGQILARHAVEELKAMRVAVLVGPGSAATDLAAAFVRQFSKEDSTRRVDRRSFQEVTGWGDVAEEVQAARPEAIVIAGAFADLTRLRRGMQQAGVKTPLLFGSTTVEPLLLEPKAESEYPVWCATMYVPDGDTKYREFVVNYQKEFGEAPHVAAQLAYDAGKVLLGALTRAKLQSRDKLREELGKAFVMRLDTGKYDQARAFKLPGR